jgi:4'-phosphopantetheinyl transferase
VTPALARVAVARTHAVLARCPDLAGAWLSDSECQRLARLRVEPRRQQYLAGHWLLRELLPANVGEPAARWSLRDRKGLPPEVLGGDPALRASISHAGDWIAAAVANVDVGVDLEQRPRELDGRLEVLLLNPAEAPGSIDSDRLLQRWVAKEAWLKSRSESALPARLQQLRLHPCAPPHANVRLREHAAFHLALAIPADATVSWQGVATSQAGFLDCRDD